MPTLKSARGRAEGRSSEVRRENRELGIEASKERSYTGKSATIIARVDGTHHSYTHLAPALRLI